MRVPAGQYADPDATPTTTPARIDPLMQRRIGATVDTLHWDSSDVRRFLGCFLSEPKPIVRFQPPASPVSRPAFRRKAATRGLALDRATQLLYDDVSFYVNG